MVVLRNTHVREFIVYSRRGCHLCDEMLEALEPLCRGRASLTVSDVDTKPEWQDAFGELVPVLYVDGEEICHYTLDRERVLGILGLSA